MNLQQISTATTSGSAQSISVTGINTDDVYMVAYTNIVPESHVRLRIRVTKSGSEDNTSNYDNARKGIRSGGSFQNNRDVDDGKWLMATLDADVGSGGSGIIYCYNFNSSSEFSYVTFNLPMWASTPQFFADVGGGVHTVASASDGISLSADGSVNFRAGGIVTLYRLVS